MCQTGESGTLPPISRYLFITAAWPDFASGGPGANIEDGSSLIIHWSSERSTNWANQYDIYFSVARTGRAWGHGPLDPLNPALYSWSYLYTAGE